MLLVVTAMGPSLVGALGVHASGAMGYWHVAACSCRYLRLRFFGLDVVLDFFLFCEVGLATRGDSGTALTGLGLTYYVLALLAPRYTQFDFGNMDQTDFEAASKMKKG